MGIPEELRTALTKQRRFLILMSVGVIAFYSLDVGIKSEAEYSGLGITLGNPGRVVVGLWIVWSWSLWRYMQRVYELLSELWKDVLEDIYAEDRRLALKAAKGEAQRQANDGKIGERRPNIEIAAVQYESSVSTLIRRGQQDHEPTPDPDFVVLTDRGRKYERLGGVYTWKDDKGNSGTSTFNFVMQWSKWRTWRHIAAATIHASLKLPAVADHVAPLLIAVAAVASPFIFN